jgi:hypothetical protein
MAEALLTRRRGARSVIWLLRGFLALVFVFVGAVKLPGGEGSPWVHIFGLIGFGQWFRIVTGRPSIVVLILLGGVLWIAWHWRRSSP